MSAPATIDGRFRIDREAGAGAMGKVYRALDEQTGRTVAVKVLQPWASGDRTLGERFDLEARLLASIAHPIIVEHVAHGTTPAGERWLAMEWIEGTTLAARLARPPGITVAESLALVHRLAGALAASHARGVVHRDVKPANVMLVGGDLAHPKLLDFGIARASDAMTLTQTGAILGTPGYMAPEQARSASSVGPAADIFSLGALLFRCLAGRTPFVGDSVVAVLAKTVIEEAPRLSDLVDVPPYVDHAVARMLSKDPLARPQGSEVLALLESLDASTAADGPPSIVRPEAITASEQRFLCAVLGRSASKVARGNVGDLALQSVAARFGGKLERLADGSFLVFFAHTDAATDLATAAARSALAIAALLPGAPLAIGFGRGVLDEGLPVSDVIDQAARSVALASALGRIAVEPTAARLLEARFDIQEGPDGTLQLVGERATATTRRLLGRITPCVGRDRDLAFLEAMIDEAIEDGGARVALVIAPAGAGKTRLREELLARVAARADRLGTLLGHGDSLRTSEPLALVSDLAASTENEETSTLLRTRRVEASAVGAVMLRAWLAFVEGELSYRPLLVIVDDLHWSDPVSIEYLDAALRVCARRPLIVIALARPEVKRSFPRLWSDRNVQELRLAGLTRRASESLVRSVLVSSPDSVVDSIVERAEGNAFYLEELVRSVAEGHEGKLPETVLAMAQVRLDALGPELGRVLRGASVFGGSLWRRGLAVVLGKDDDSKQLDGWLTTLVDRELLERRPESLLPDEEELVFRHDLLRETAYEMLTAADRALAHRLAGEWLEARQFPLHATLGEHFLRAGEPSRAARWFTEAAEHALDGADPSIAIDMAERALSLGAEGEWFVRAHIVEALAYNRSARSIESASHARAAIAQCREGTAVWYAAMGALLVALVRGTRVEALGEAIEKLNESSPTADPEASRAMLIATADAAIEVARYCLVDAGVALMTRLAPFVERGATGDAQVDARLQAVRGMVERRRGNLLESMAAFRRACALYEVAGEMTSVCSSRITYAADLTSLGRLDEVRAEVWRAIADAERLNLPGVLSVGLYGMSLVAWSCNELEEALALAERALATVGVTTDPMGEGRARIAESLIVLDLGDAPRAERAARRALDRLDRIPALRRIALTACARALLAQGRGEDALALMSEAESIPPGEVELEGPLIPLVRADALEMTGDPAGAAAVILEAARALEEQSSRFSEASARAGVLTSSRLHVQLLERARHLRSTGAGQHRP
jgi:tetratricopeptide (TPR) repeat protein